VEEKLKLYTGSKFSKNKFLNINLQLRKSGHSGIFIQAMDATSLPSKLGMHAR
jgi:hypothetical protein